MSVKVAINGFGRIGRLAFRQMFGAEGYEVVAINDLTSAKMLAHLLKYDSTQGNYVAQGHTVDFHEGEGEDNYIVVDGKKIVIYKMPNAADLPWGKLGVDVVLECTGFYTSKAKAQAHIDAGARKVVISAPAGNDLPTIVYNVNHKTLTKEDTIISAASCTTNCLAPMAKALNDLAPIQSGTILYTARSDEFPTEEGQQKAVATCKLLGLEGIVAMGGDGTFRGLLELSKHGISVVGVPATIDNDISCTDYTIGYDTAANTAVEAIDRLRDTMQSHERCSVVEVMGRNAGHLALYVGLATGPTAASSARSTRCRPSQTTSCQTASPRRTLCATPSRSRRSSATSARSAARA